PRGSGLGGAERGGLADPPSETATLDHLDHALHLLVGERRLLGEAFARGRADDDPLRLELAAEIAALDALARRRPREGTAGAVASRAKRPLQRVRLAGEHEAGRAHAA